MRSSRGSLPERSGAPLLHARTRRVSAQRSDDSRDPAGLRDGRLVLRVAGNTRANIIVATVTSANKTDTDPARNAAKKG